MKKPSWRPDLYRVSSEHRVEVPGFGKFNPHLDFDKLRKLPVEERLEVISETPISTLDYLNTVAFLGILDGVQSDIKKRKRVNTSYLKDAIIFRKQLVARIREIKGYKK